MRRAVATVFLLLASCKEGGASIVGSAKNGDGQPVVRATAVLRCPDQLKRTAQVDANGDFRFKDLGAGVDGACTVEIEGAGIGGAQRTMSTHCIQSDARSGQCTEARFDFVM